MLKEKDLEDVISKHKRSACHLEESIEVAKNDLSFLSFEKDAEDVCAKLLELYMAMKTSDSVELIDCVKGHLDEISSSRRKNNF